MVSELPPEPRTPTTVSICVCTFRRAELLHALLLALSNQKLDGTVTPPEIVVVDNDPEHSALPILTDWSARLPGRLIFLHVPVPNISVARNAAIHAARGDWIALIDDDEEPRPDWLAQLIATQRSSRAEAIFAPVVPRFSPSVPQWLIDGRFFDRPRFASGTAIDERDARTGNVLIAAKQIKALCGPFDPAFGRTGGEDSLLFRQLLAHDCKFVWCDEADVCEEVPLARASAHWLLQRSFRTGQIWLRVELAQKQGSARLLRGAYLGARAVLQLLLATLAAIAFTPLSKIRAFRWLRVAASQCGKLSGLTRHTSIAYGQ